MAGARVRGVRSTVPLLALHGLALLGCLAPDEPPPTSSGHLAQGEPDAAGANGAAGAARAPAESLEGSRPEAPGEALADSDDAPDAPDAIAGHAAARYRGRSGDGVDDHDIYTTLYADVGLERPGDWTYHLLGTAYADLDGSADSTDEFVFFGLADTYDSPVHGDLYHLHADYHGRGALERGRVGRQLDYATPELAWFDGASVELAERGARQSSGGLYGGIPVHAYESSPEGDVVFGLWGQTHPWKGGRLRLDWMHLEDEYLLAENEDDLIALSAWQTLARAWRVEGAYTTLEGDARDLELSGAWLAEEQDLVLRASFYRLLEAQTQQVIELDPFTTSLFELFPYEQARVLASKSFGGTWSLEGGFDVRRVDDEGDIGQFNRDFERYFATVASSQGLLPWDLEAALTVDSYDSQGDDVRSFGGDLARAVSQRDEVSVGTYYSLYKYDIFQNEERDDVRTYFARLRRELGESRTFDLRYEYEDDDDEDYHTLRVGTTWQF